jgi:hypothetical protein
MDTSDNVAVPQLYVPFGAHLANGMSVCLVETGSKGRIKYGACDSDRVVKVKAVLSESGDYTGVYRTKKVYTAQHYCTLRANTAGLQKDEHCKYVASYFASIDISRGNAWLYAARPCG